MMKINKLIFLDVDGVLNSDRWSKWIFHNRWFLKEGGHRHIDPNGVSKVIEICKQTDAKIILSSSWRLWNYEQTKNNLGGLRDLRPLLEYLVGITEKTEDRHRGTEIKKYLERCKDQNFYWEHGWLKNPSTTIEISEDSIYIIIDDDEDMLDEQLPYFIHTDFMDGISTEDVNNSIKLLNRTV